MTKIVVTSGTKLSEKDIKRIIDDLLNLKDGIDYSTDPSDVGLLSHPFYQYLENRAIDGYFVKDNAFREEKEKRLLYSVCSLIQ